MLPRDGAVRAPRVPTCRGGRAPCRRDTSVHRPRNADRLARGLAQDRPDPRCDRRHPRGDRRRLHPLPRRLRLMLASSHSVPQGNRPIIASGIVVVAALPLFLIAGWPIAGWGLAAVLWVAAQLIG